MACEYSQLFQAISIIIFEFKRPPIKHQSIAFISNFIVLNSSGKNTYKRMESSKKKSNYLLLFYNTKAELHIPLLLSSSNASLFTQFAISYTLREKKRTKRIPITAYQSLGRMKYAGHVFFRTSCTKQTMTILCMFSFISQ